MTFEEARKNLIDLELREFAYDHAAGMLYFDGRYGCTAGNLCLTRQDALGAE